MSNQKMAVPKFPCLDEFSIPLAKIVAQCFYLPAVETVREVGDAVFPTLRDSKRRITGIDRDGLVVGMYDDNTTPRWALLWAHGIPGVGKYHSKNWTFAHVWPSKDDLGAYTHLGNLAMVPECFGSLTDKLGPLTHFLRWHSWETYGWKPVREGVPLKPSGYDEITWNYFPSIPEPMKFIFAQLERANCKRSQILKPLFRSRIP